MDIPIQGGDNGMTQVITGDRVWKDDPRVTACGELDELGSWLGVVASFMPPQHEEQRGRIVQVQRELFAIGAILQAAGRAQAGDLCARVEAAQGVGGGEQR